MDNQRTDAPPPSRRGVRPAHERYRLVDEEPCATKPSSDVIRSRRYRREGKTDQQADDKTQIKGTYEMYGDGKRNSYRDSLELERPVFSSVEGSFEASVSYIGDKTDGKESSTTSHKFRRKPDTPKQTNVSDSLERPIFGSSDLGDKDTDKSSRPLWRRDVADDSVGKSTGSGRIESRTVSLSRLKSADDVPSEEVENKPPMTWRQRKLERERREKEKSEQEDKNKLPGRVESRDIDTSRVTQTEVASEHARSDRLKSDSAVASVQKRSLDRSERPKSIDVETMRKMMLTSESPLLRSRYREALRKRDEGCDSSSHDSREHSVTGESKGEFSVEADSSKTFDKKFEKSKTSDKISSRPLSLREKASSVEDMKNSVKRDPIVSATEEHIADKQSEPKKRILVSSRSKLENLKDSVKRPDDHGNEHKNVKYATGKESPKLRTKSPLATAYKEADAKPTKPAGKPDNEDSMSGRTLYSRRTLSSTGDKQVSSGIHKEEQDRSNTRNAPSKKALTSDENKQTKPSQQKVLVRKPASETLPSPKGERKSNVRKSTPTESTQKPQEQKSQTLVSKIPSPKPSPKLSHKLRSDERKVSEIKDRTSSSVSTKDIGSSEKSPSLTKRSLHARRARDHGQEGASLVKHMSDLLFEKNTKTAASAEANIVSEGNKESDKMLSSRIPEQKGGIISERLAPTRKVSGRDASAERKNENKQDKSSDPSMPRKKVSTRENSRERRTETKTERIADKSVQSKLVSKREHSKERIGEQKRERSTERSAQRKTISSIEQSLDRKGKRDTSSERMRKTQGQNVSETKSAVSKRYQDSIKRDTSSERKTKRETSSDRTQERGRQVEKPRVGKADDKNVFLDSASFKGTRQDTKRGVKTQMESGRSDDAKVSNIKCDEVAKTSSVAIKKSDVKSQMSKTHSDIDDGSKSKQSQEMASDTPVVSVFGGDADSTMSRAERIALYKEERRRQLAYIATKLGSLEKEGTQKEVVPSLFHAAREKSVEREDTSLGRSRSLKEKSPEKFLSPVMRSRSLRKDFSPLRDLPNREAQQKSVSKSDEKKDGDSDDVGRTSITSFDESGKEVPLTEKIKNTRQLFEQRSIEDEEVKKVHRKSLTDSSPRYRHSLSDSQSTGDSTSVKENVSADGHRISDEVVLDKSREDSQILMDTQRKISKDVSNDVPSSQKGKKPIVKDIQKHEESNLNIALSKDASRTSDREKLRKKYLFGESEEKTKEPLTKSKLDKDVSKGESVSGKILNAEKGRNTSEIEKMFQSLEKLSPVETKHTETETIAETTELNKQEAMNIDTLVQKEPKPPKRRRQLPSIPTALGGESPSVEKVSSAPVSSASISTVSVTPSQSSSSAPSDNLSSANLAIASSSTKPAQNVSAKSNCQNLLSIESDTKLNVDRSMIDETVALEEKVVFAPKHEDTKYLPSHVKLVEKSVMRTELESKGDDTRSSKVDVSQSNQVFPETKVKSEETVAKYEPTESKLEEKNVTLPQEARAVSLPDIVPVLVSNKRDSDREPEVKHATKSLDENSDSVVSRTFKDNADNQSRQHSQFEMKINTKNESQKIESVDKQDVRSTGQKHKDSVRSKRQSPARSRILVSSSASRARGSGNAEEAEVDKVKVVDSENIINDDTKNRSELELQTVSDGAKSDLDNIKNENESRNSVMNISKGISSMPDVCENVQLLEKKGGEVLSKSVVSSDVKTTEEASTNLEIDDSKTRRSVSPSPRRKSYSSDEGGKNVKKKLGKPRFGKSGGLHRSKTITEKELKSPGTLQKERQIGNVVITQSKDAARRILLKSPETNLDELLLQNEEYLSDIETKEPWAVRKRDDVTSKKEDSVVKSSDDEQGKKKRFHPHRREALQRRKSESDSILRPGQLDHVEK